MGWEVDPSGLAALLDRLHAWDPSMPLHITENGVARPHDARRADGSVDDQDRIGFAQPGPGIDAGVHRMVAGERQAHRPVLHDRDAPVMGE